MKKMIFAVAMMAIACVGFSSCDDDCTCTYKDFETGETVTEKISEDELKGVNCSDLSYSDDTESLSCK